MSVDDSVIHAWTAIEMSIGGELLCIDAGIAPLVEALNQLPGVRTLASCEGHPHSQYDRRAYVMFEWQGATLWLSVFPDEIAQAADWVRAAHERDVSAATARQDR